MDSDSKQGYKPPPEFQLPGLDGQELSLNLHRDGQLGSFEDSSGKYKSSAVVHGRNSSLSIPFLC
uniref:Uncharacterized protein n=1 Tax=Fagus sylvatica TaxID=28930 RepID=A0A2N9FAU2_FAGSY